jgi:hypothetical protein
MSISNDNTKDSDLLIIQNLKKKNIFYEMFMNNEDCYLAVYREWKINKNDCCDNYNPNYDSGYEVCLNCGRCDLDKQITDENFPELAEVIKNTEELQKKSTPQKNTIFSKAPNLTSSSLKKIGSSINEKTKKMSDVFSSGLLKFTNSIAHVARSRYSSTANSTAGSVENKNVKDSFEKNLKKKFWAEDSDAETDTETDVKDNFEKKLKKKFLAEDSDAETDTETDVKDNFEKNLMKKLLAEDLDAETDAETDIDSETDENFNSCYSTGCKGSPGSLGVGGNGISLSSPYVGYGYGGGGGGGYYGGGGGSNSGGM